jgi:SAM-dependent methyltransferase
MQDDADRIIDHYERHALAWAEARGDRLVEGLWIDRFAALLPPGADILDLGCGPGVPIARDLRDRGHRVTGVDSAPTMIAMFAANLPGATTLVGDMRTLMLDRRYDGLLAWDSFFHLRFDDQRAMFPIFRDHLRDGGALMFTSGPRHGVAMGSFEGDPLYHASLDPGEYRALLADHGLAVVDSGFDDPACGGHSVWLARKLGRHTAC